METMKLAYSIEEVAEALGVAQSTVRKMVATGQLPVRRIGVGRGRLIIPAKAIEDLLNGEVA